MAAVSRAPAKVPTKAVRKIEPLTVHPNAITAFRGAYAFLSSFHRVGVYYDGVVYPSREHAFQASKTLVLAERQRIRVVSLPADAKKVGQRVRLRPDWEQIKRNIMYELHLQSYQRNPGMAILLERTGERELVEGNTWGDTYWGVCDGVGQNWLGKILMRIRRELRTGDFGVPKALDTRRGPK